MTVFEMNGSPVVGSIQLLSNSVLNVILSKLLSFLHNFCTSNNTFCVLLLLIFSSCFTLCCTYNSHTLSETFTEYKSIVFNSDGFHFNNDDHFFTNGYGSSIGVNIKPSLP